MRIMIIDDEPDIRDYLMAALEDNGYETCTIEEGQPISDAVRSCNPDLIMLDIMMPNRSGVSIYIELRSNIEFNSIPIVILSGMMPEKDFKNGFGKLMDDNAVSFPDGFIEKPVQLDEMFAVVKKRLK